MRSTLLLPILLAACSSPVGLRVFAASSLQEVLPRVAEEYTRTTGQPITFVFDATSRLAGQVRAGAAMDVFLSADERWTQDLVDAGFLAPHSVRTVVGNRLVVIVPAQEKNPPSSLSDLADPRFVRIAMAGEEVPAGRYARAALDHGGFTGALEGRITSGQSVRTALRWVADAEMPVGFVFWTDAAVEPRVKVAFVVPADHHPPIRVTAGFAPGAPPAAEVFLAWCAEQGRSVFLRAGFITP